VDEHAAGLNVHITIKPHARVSIEQAQGSRILVVPAAEVPPLTPATPPTLRSHHALFGTHLSTASKYYCLALSIDLLVFKHRAAALIIATDSRTGQPVSRVPLLSGVIHHDYGNLKSS
jgi:hypothetical protein